MSRQKHLQELCKRCDSNESVFNWQFMKKCLSLHHCKSGNLLVKVFTEIIFSASNFRRLKNSQKFLGSSPLVKSRTDV